MRTLKKTLALVLVLAMMFSLCITASADFIDADEITYVEAADVLAAIGVIEGMPDGSFDAKGTLTRAQAAVMITRLLGAEDYAIATAGQFTDVAANHWAAGAISFCVDAGIVAGYGDGKFGPSDTLTGYQWAKMLLCALGYNADSEGMTGAAWQIAVAKLAKANDIFAGNNEADKTVAATREEAALYAFNLFDAWTVKYEGGNSITVGDITFTSGGDRVQGDIDSPNKTPKFGTEYFPYLKASALTTDDFGRPAHGWYYGKTETKDTFIGLYVDEAAISYTATVAEAALTKTLKGYTFKDEVADAYDTVAEVAAATGNGVLVEIFINAYNEIYAVTVEPAFTVTRVTAVKDTPATKTRGAYTTYTFADASTGKVFSTVVNADNDKDTIVLHGDFAKGDYVLKNTVAGYANYYPVEIIKGAVTAITSAGVYTIGGKDYKLSEYNTASISVDTTTEKTFILDNYGYIIASISPDTADTVYGMVIAPDSETVLADGKLTTTQYAIVALTDGSVEKLTLAAALDNTLVGKVVTIETNKKGVSTLTDTDADVELDAVTTKDATLTESLYASNTTKYVFANYVWSDTYSKYVVDGTVTVVTGKDNVGTYTTKAYAVDVAVGGKTDGIADVVYVYENVRATTSDKFVYALGTGTDYGTYTTYDVIIKGEATTIDTEASLTGGELYSNVTNGSTAELARKFDNKGVVANYAGYLKNDDTVYTEDDYKVASDAVVYAINETYLEQGDVTVATYNFADLEDAMPAGEVYLQYNASGYIAAIYVIYTVAD